ncbi:MAG: hypothetical protein WCR01_00540 [Bacteroidota bacterium]
MPVGKWIWPLLLVSLLVFILSLRQLSDPDLGFHLKYGKWIVDHQRVPVSDLSTYTVPQHPYIDLHWMFQVVLYGVFRLTGYPGISLFICLLSLLLSLLLLFRQQISGIPVPVTCTMLLITFLIIDPRIAPRPEMFTFLFLSLLIFILDLYHAGRKNLLFLLPLIMLFWCNMHALFILGIITVSVYFLSTLIRDRKADKTLLSWAVVSVCICFINPYGVKGFTLPVELLTRFNPNNIYNQHIQEFMPFFAHKYFVLRDYLFIMLLGLTLVFTALTYKNRKFHEFILLALFGFLSIGSIRNIPLFVLVAMPIVSQEISELTGRIGLWRDKVERIFYMLLIIIPLFFIPRILTNAFYMWNNSFNKTGMGINSSHQPLNASAFLLEKHLDGRILNSIGFGGWLSWTLPQPVFIDGRLEVIQEPLYQEVTKSWDGRLPEMIGKYHPRLIVYNYLKYYPWTLQLKNMKDWRLIYADGIAAVFAHRDYACEIPELVVSNLSLSRMADIDKSMNDWLQGFYRPANYPSIDLIHLSLLSLQLDKGAQGKTDAEKAVAFFNSANKKYSDGNFHGALADYDTAILLRPGYSKAYNNRGILRASAFSDYPGAIADFNKAINLNPHYGDAYLGRGTSNFLLKNLHEACNDWATAHSLGNQQAARLMDLYCNQ